MAKCIHIKKMFQFLRDSLTRFLRKLAWKIGTSLLLLYESRNFWNGTAIFIGSKLMFKLPENVFCSKNDDWKADWCLSLWWIMEIFMVFDQGVDFTTNGIAVSLIVSLELLENYSRSWMSDFINTPFSYLNPPEPTNVKDFNRHNLNIIHTATKH